MSRCLTYELVTGDRWWQLKYVSNVHPYFGKLPILTNSFQRGCNLQVGSVFLRETKNGLENFVVKVNFDQGYPGKM